jgi:DNA-binding NarL/FixJ family response regulator
MITVAIVDDDRQICTSLRELIDATPGYHCVCVCENTQTALVEIPRHAPDVVLMDINLPGKSGIFCTERLKHKMPSLQIIMLTIFRDPKVLFPSLKAGACGYLLKRSNPREILEAIADVHAGGAPMSEEIARLVVEAFHKRPSQPSEEQELSHREEEVLMLIAKGLTNKEIADQLNLTTNTIRAHVRNIYDKLHVQRRIEAINKFQQRSDSDAKNWI